MLNSSSSNENIFLPSASTTLDSSPNRSKYEKKFLKKSSLLNKTTTTSNSSNNHSATTSRKPLSEKTKVIGNSSTASSSESLPRSGATCEFDDLFSPPPSAPSSSAEVELKSALASALQENEQLVDRVKLLQLEIERLQAEVEENREYAELYLLSKELIQEQGAEIDSLKLKLAALAEEVADEVVDEE